ncbi:MAG: hypothetical protein HY518_00085 [Candidatus Aenigmarchaeota archaeon]|nr:hypothetical protein [Candidatus Aenigmarchaeota archaeon]
MNNAFGISAAYFIVMTALVYFMHLTVGLSLPEVLVYYIIILPAGLFIYYELSRKATKDKTVGDITVEAYKLGWKWDIKHWYFSIPLLVIGFYLYYTNALSGVYGGVFAIAVGAILLTANYKNSSLITGHPYYELAEKYGNELDKKRMPISSTKRVKTFFYILPVLLVILGISIILYNLFY